MFFTQKWPLKKKYWTLAVICFSAFAATLTPTSHQLAYVLQAPLYHRSVIDMSYTITVAIAGLFIGPLIFTPLARVFGRTSILFWCLLAALVCQIWAARMTHETNYMPFLISRLLAGMFSGLPTIFGPAYAVDIFFLHQRGKAFVSYELSLLGGVIAGPTIGGFIVQSKPWPFVFWWTIAPVGVALVLVFCFLEETGFQRDEDGQPYPRKPAEFIPNRIATFFPGNRIIRSTSYRDLVGNYVLSR